MNLFVLCTFRITLVEKKTGGCHVCKNVKAGSDDQPPFSYLQQQSQMFKAQTNSSPIDKIVFFSDIYILDFPIESHVLGFAITNFN